MENYGVSKFSNFFLIGVDHNRTPVEVREQFTLNEEKASHLIYDYKQDGGEGMMILSTCNRTEIYAFGNCPRKVIDLFCKYTGQSKDTFDQYQNIKQNREAIDHLFRVGSGLESKILGDFEIIGQIKKAYQFAKGQDVHNAFLDRLVNSAVQCSKKVKNQTELSTGATSVAFAAVMQMKKYLLSHDEPKVLLIGMGKIGRTTCENLVNQTGIKDITLINRTEAKAERLAQRFGVKHADLEHLQENLNLADVVIVATGAQNPTILPEHFTNAKPRMLLDLSMPRNVHTDLYRHPDFEVIDVDHLSDVVTESIEKRRAQIPVAEAVIEETIDEFYEWLESRKVAPTLQALREKMDDWSAREVQNIRKKYPEMDAEKAELLADQLIKRITGQLARGLKNGPDLPVNLRAISHIFDLQH